MASAYPEHKTESCGCLLFTNARLKSFFSEKTKNLQEGTWRKVHLEVILFATDDSASVPSVFIGNTKGFGPA